MTMLVVLLALAGSVMSQTYHSEVLDMAGKYRLHWGLTNTTLEIKVVVNTTGWIGFGLSPTGGMKGSDIVMGWINADGSKSFSDRFAPVEDVPVIDTVQSYELLELSEANAVTTMRFRRDLTTCDEKDALILGTARVIFAYNDEKPVNGVPSKHPTMQRGTRSINILNRAPLGVPPTETTTTVDILFDKAVAPGSYGRTRYWWRGFKFPQTTKHHIVGYEPIIPLAELGQTHHMLVYLCKSPLAANALDYVGSSHGNAPSALAQCNFQRPIAGWAVGGLTNWMPKEFGLPVGTDDTYRYALLELHLDVINSTADTITNAGIRFHLTNQLRPNDGSIVTFGASVDSWLVSPPNAVSERRGYCVSDCTNATIPASNMLIYAAMLHAHTAGVKIHVQHIDTNGTELAPIASDQHYDFNLQQWSWMDTPLLFKRGDQAIVTCTYNTAGRTKVTLGGESTSEEMCLVYMLVYSPAPGATVALSTCLSTGTTNGYLALIAGNAFKQAPPTNNDIDGYLKSVADWSNFEPVFTATMKNRSINTIQPLCGTVNGFAAGAPRPLIEPKVAYVPPDNTQICARRTTVASTTSASTTTSTTSSGVTSSDSTDSAGTGSGTATGTDTGSDTTDNGSDSTAAGSTTAINVDDSTTEGDAGTLAIAASAMLCAVLAFLA